MRKKDGHGLIGRIIDRKYLITELIGEGGMGAVYKAQHTGLKRDCAVKLVRRQHVDDPVAMKRFGLEAEAAALLKHPNIIEVYDFGSTEDELPYLVMEYLPGKSLDEFLKARKYLHYEEALPIFLQVCDALAHAHEKKVLHRDLKPGNIVLLAKSSDEFEVKLVDFGIAKLLPGTGRPLEKLTLTGQIFGSPMYMSPEQCMGQALDARSDIYAMGCVMYETLTGKLPFVGETLFQVIMQHVNEAALSFAEVSPDIAIPEELERIVLQCMEKERVCRYSHVNELRQELSQIYRVRQFKDRLPAGSGGDTLAIDQTVELKTDQQKNSESPRPRKYASEDALLKKISDIEEVYGQDSRKLIRLVAELYRFYISVDELAKAIETKKRELALLKKYCGENSLDIAYCLEDIGTTALSQKSFAEAEKYFRETLKMKLKLLGSEDIECCKTRVYLAEALAYQGKEDEADELVHDSRFKARSLRGDLSLEAADIESHAGHLYFMISNYEKSLNHYLAASSIVRNKLGAHDQGLRDNLVSQARCLQSLERFDELVKLCKQILQIDEKLYLHAEISQSDPWNLLAWGLYKLERVKEAEEACTKFLEILSLLEYCPAYYLASAHEMMADILEAQDRMNEALQYRRKAKEIEKEG